MIPRKTLASLVILFLIILSLLAYLLTRQKYSISLNSPPVPTPLPSPSVLGLQIGKRTQTSACQASNSLPDPDCTPGAVFSDITIDQICTPGYTKTVRNVGNSLRDQVYAAYGITSHPPGQYEVDHLIPLELGGNNDIANLWPESANPTPGFHQKDKVENYLHDEVCHGKISLESAQYIIASDWLQVLPQVN